MGYWTYHRVYGSGCCGPCCGPCCLLMLLTVPLWPIIGGFISIKDKITASNPKTVVSEVDENMYTEIDDIISGTNNPSETQQI